MYVEDILLFIHHNLISRYGSQSFDGLLHGAWYQNFIASVAQHICNDRALSSNQSHTILKLVRRVRSQLIKLGTDAAELDRLLAKPEHRQPPYESSRRPREARYLGNNMVALRCKVDGLLIAHIKALGMDEGLTHCNGILRSRPRFEWTQKLWIVSVHRYNLQSLRTLLQEHRFHLDQILIDYLALCQASVDQSSTITRMDDDVLIANVCDDDILASWMTTIANGIIL